MFVVDTNVLLYAVNAAAPEHQRCRSLLETWRAGTSPWFTSWGILYEFLRISTHPRVFSQPLSTREAWSFITALQGGSLQLLLHTARHHEIAAVVLAEAGEVRGNLFHDFETAALMREHGIGTIYTRDTDYHRFRGLRVLDPLAD